MCEGALNLGWLLVSDVYGGSLDGQRCWPFLRAKTCWQFVLLAVSVQAGATVGIGRG